MRYRRLGRTELEVSELSFGAARGAKADSKQFIRTVRAALDEGINFFDTAESYEDGESERMLGEALVGTDGAIIETKYRPYDSHQPDAHYTGTPEALVASAEASLKRLRRDHIDVFLAHGIRSFESLHQFMKDGCYEAMVRLREQGKVRHIGLSELSEADGKHAILKQTAPTGAFDVVMLTLNFVLQTAAETVVPLCNASDIGTVVMMPLNQASKESGLVSVEAARECVRRHIEYGNLQDGPPYTDSDLFDFLEPFSVPEAGLRYVLAHPVGTCCVGMRSPARVTENCRAVDPPYLDKPTLAQLRKLFGGIAWQVR